MRVFDRLFLFLYSIVFMIFSLFLLLIGSGFFKYDFLHELTDSLLFNSDIKLSIIIGSSLAIIISTYFIIKSLQFKQDTPFSNTVSELGEIKISMETLENLAMQVIAKVNGVKDKKAKVRLEENDKITILIRISVDGTTPIPKISEDIQLNVKQHIENIAGISVGQVHVIVSNVGTTNVKKTRVE